MIEIEELLQMLTGIVKKGFFTETFAIVLVIVTLAVASVASQKAVDCV